MNRKTNVFLTIAFAWTWGGWIASYLISRFQDSDLLTDRTIFNLWADAWGSPRFLPQMLFAIAVYGPLVGFFVTARNKKDLFRNSGRLTPFCYYVVLIPVISAIPSFGLSLFTSYYDPKNLAGTSVVITVGLYFLSNLMTSGTEEFGWRGVLYPNMKASGMSFWDIAWKGGLIWAAWHLPLLFILYLPLGLTVLIPSIIGFAASIVAMNFITNFIYEQTRNILFTVVLHALNNTMSFLVVLLFPKTPFTILSSLMAWVIVWWIEKKYPKLVA